MYNQLKIFSGSSNPDLADEIAKHLNTDLGEREIIKFSNENIKVKIKESVRGQDVFVVQTSCPPVSDNIM
ncbi:MAG: ribose-phosphate pyrophosphokinase-like domain-containing protein, partial [Candidatus Poribacteria bacterium]